MPQPHLPFLEFLSGALALDNAPALCDDTSEEWLRYGALRERVKNLVPCWKGSPERRGLALCAVPRSADGVMAYLSALASGHALLLVDSGTVRPDLFIEHYKPDWILLPAPIKPRGPYAARDFPLPNFYLWQRVEAAPEEIHPDLCFLLLPPGPPESFKTVRISYNAIAHNTQASIKAMDFAQDTRPLLVMPLSYSFGLSILHMTLSVGGSLFISEKNIKSRELWELSQKRDVTLFAGVPYHYDYLIRAGLENLHVPRIKTFLQAGGRMPPDRVAELLRQIEARKGELFILYGLTEASPRITVLPLHDYPEKIGSSGQVIEGGRLTPSRDGLLYSGPNVMMGYAESRADLSKGDTQHGQLLIKDPATLDEEGFLFFAG